MFAPQGFTVYNSYLSVIITFGTFQQIFRRIMRTGAAYVPKSSSLEALSLFSNVHLAEIDGNYIRQGYHELEHGKSLHNESAMMRAWEKFLTANGSADTFTHDIVDITREVCSSRECVGKYHVCCLTMRRYRNTHWMFMKI